MKYIDINGNKKHADSGQDKLLKLLYTTRTGRMLLRPLVTPAFSKLAGALLNTSFSCRLIEPSFDPMPLTWAIMKRPVFVVTMIFSQER